MDAAEPARERQSPRRVLEAEADLGPVTTTIASRPVPSGHDPLGVESLLSRGRFASYLSATGGDCDQAVALYRWNTALSAACFEAIHYVEVVVRNAMDREMRTHRQESATLIPWFLMPVVGKHQANFDESIERVRRRLRDQGRDRETRDQIIAGTDFGFWTALLHSENEELWRQALRKAFPHSSGRRKDVVGVLEPRLAHHDSLLGEDVAFRLDQMRQVLRWVDPRAEQWLREVERVSTLLRERPASRRDAADTVVVAARDAWPLYREIGAYVCQPGRAFRPVGHLAFYTDREIKPEVASVRRRVDNVEWSEAEADRLTASDEADEQRLGEIMSVSRARGWLRGRYQVFFLTRPGEPGHLSPRGPIPNPGKGKGSAFTQRQRYTSPPPPSSSDRVRGYTAGQVAQ